MNINEIYKLLDKNIIIYTNENTKHIGYAREIVLPEEDEEIQEPILVLEIEGRKSDTIDGFYINDIKSAKTVH